MEELAKRIKELRTEKQVSLMTLGKAIGVSDVAVMKWENNISEPTATNIRNLALYFDVTTDYLLGLENFDYTKSNMNINNSFNNNINTNINIRR